jgi:uncharacterized protein (TIGR03083 family)
MTDSTKTMVLARLTAAREPLLACLQELDEVQWQTAVQSEDAQWSIADIVRHLNNAESGMIGLIQQWRIGNNPVPADFDLSRFNQRAVQKTQNLTPAELLAALQSNRQQLLTVIDSLEPDDWAKNGRHGSLQILTIEQVCLTIAGHEEIHLADIQTALN